MGKLLCEWFFRYGLVVMLCVCLVSAQTTTTTTTVEDDATVDEGCEEGDDWCTQPGEMIPRNASYLIIGGVCLVLLFLTRQDRKTMVMIVLWAALVLSFYFIEIVFFWYFLLIFNFIVYHLLYRAPKEED